jgi:hypothetical protein
VWEGTNSNPVGEKLFSSPHPFSWSPCSLLCNGYRISFSGVKQSGHGLENSPALSPRVTMDTAINLLPSCAANIFTYQWPAYDGNNYCYSVGFVIKRVCKILNQINLTYFACILYEICHLFICSSCLSYINPFSSNTKGSHYH